VALGRMGGMARAVVSQPVGWVERSAKPITPIDVISNRRMMGIATLNPSYEFL
jgi:hypothetical protein